LDWLKAHCTKLLPPVIVWEDRATLACKQVFVITAHSGARVKVAGCGVSKGKVARGDLVEVRRDGSALHRAKVRQLRHVKDEVDEVTAGKDCGILFDGDYDGFLVGDQLVVVASKEVPRQFLPDTR